MTENEQIIEALRVLKSKRLKEITELLDDIDMIELNEARPLHEKLIHPNPHNPDIVPDSFLLPQ